MKTLNRKKNARRAMLPRREPPATGTGAREPLALPLPALPPIPLPP